MYVNIVIMTGENSGIDTDPSPPSFERDHALVEKAADIMMGAPHVTQVHWFGSRSRGEGRRESDYDMVALTADCEDRTEAARRMDEAKSACQQSLAQAGFALGNGPGQIDLWTESDHFLGLPLNQLGGYVRIFLSGIVVRSRPGISTHSTPIEKDRAERYERIKIRRKK